MTDEEGWAWLIPGKYKLTADGRVFRVAHSVVATHGQTRHYPLREMRICKHSPSGRPVVNLHLGRGYQRRYVYVDLAMYRLFGTWMEFEEVTAPANTGDDLTNAIPCCTRRPQ